MGRNTAPEWAQHLTDADEWVVRNALALAASDLRKLVETIEPDEGTRAVLDRAIHQYELALARIADAEGI